MREWKRRGRWLSICVVGLGLLVLAPVVWAEDAPNDQADANRVAAVNATVATPAADTDSDASIMSLVVGSGPTGWVFGVILLLFSMVGATVAIERAVNTRRSKIIPLEFVGDLKKLVGQADAGPSSFRELCSGWTSPISNILRAGLLRCGRPLTEVEKTMEDAAAREMASLRGGIRPLNVVGNVAPLIGLLGTVVGMIIAFRTASQAGLGKGELMAEGIYMALLTTAAGLTIAIPALLLSALFNSKVEKFFREIDEHLMATMPCFARMEQVSIPQPATNPPPTKSAEGDDPIMWVAK